MLPLYLSHGRVALTSASVVGHGPVGENRPRPGASAIIPFESSQSGLIHLVAEVEVLLLRSPQCGPVL